MRRQDPSQREESAAESEPPQAEIVFKKSSASFQEICSSVCSVRRPTATTIPAASHNFAVSLHLFSAKAYEFMRKTFLLPEPTILHMILQCSAERPQAGKLSFQVVCSPSWHKALRDTNPLLSFHQAFGRPVISVTSDAIEPNIDTTRQLGVKVDGSTVKSTFLYSATPTLEIEYYSTSTPSHLLSLIHNLLEADGNFQMNGKAVSWECILHLGALQEKEVRQAGANRTVSAVFLMRAAAATPMERASEHHCPSTNAVTFNSLCNEYENLLHKLGTTIGELSNHHWGFCGFLLNLRSLHWMMQKLNYWQKTNPLLVCSLVGGFWISWSGIELFPVLALTHPPYLYADKVVYSCKPLSIWANMAVALGFKASPKDGHFEKTAASPAFAECCATLLSPCKELPVGSALTYVKSQGKIYRAKQVIALSPWFFQGSSPSDCLAQEWAILEYIFLLYPPYDRPAVTKLRQQPKLEHRSTDIDVDCGEAKSSTKCGSLSDRLLWQFYNLKNGQKQTYTFGQSQNQTSSICGTNLLAVERSSSQFWLSLGSRRQEDQITANLPFLELFFFSSSMPEIYVPCAGIGSMNTLMPQMEHCASAEDKGSQKSPEFLKPNDKVTRPENTPGFCLSKSLRELFPS
ncbi:THAP domain-containing protein 9, partial [Ophiophagus hannah]